MHIDSLYISGSFLFFSAVAQLTVIFGLMDVLLMIYKQEFLITEVVQGLIFLLFAQMVD